MSTHQNRARATAQTGALWHIASTRLLTNWGMFEAMGFERELWTVGRTAETALALVLGDLSQGVPLPRAHSQCLTGEVFGSLRCDCGGRLNLAMQALRCEVGPTAHSLAYLQRKKQKMGHVLSLEIPGPGHAAHGIEAQL